MKTLKTNTELVEYMENKGIKFNIIDKDYAINFFNRHTYYTKFSAFKSNYNKNSFGKYINLEFAYLKELSTIDMYLRKILFDMCLDIEHYIKITILNYLSNNGYDGYDIMKEYIQYQEKNTKYTMKALIDSLKSQSKTSYTKDLIDAYYPYVPVWVFLETASFGDVSRFYSYFYSVYDKNLNNNIKIIKPHILNRVRVIRNACAHNSCIINKLTKECSEYTQGVNLKQTHTWIKNISTISDDSRKNNLQKSALMDISTVIYAFDNMVSSLDIKNTRYYDFKMLLSTRMLRNKTFFTKNEMLVSSYNFIKKIIDYVLTTSNNM